MHNAAIIPTFACFAGSGSAGLRTLLGIVAAFWMIAAMASIVNISLLMLFAVRRQPVVFHSLLFGLYVAAASGLYYGWLWEMALPVAAWAIFVIPLVAIVHFLVLIKTYKTFGKLRRQVVLNRRAQSLVLFPTRIHWRDFDSCCGQRFWRRAGCG